MTLALTEEKSRLDSVVTEADPPRVSFTSWLCVLVRLVKELARAASFPVRMLLYLPQHATYQDRSRKLLEAATRDDATDPGDEARRNDDARRRFRACMEDRFPEHVFVSCGEHSGEGHATAFVKELRRLAPDARITGFGGRVLEAENVTLLANLVDDAVMGVLRVLARVPHYMRIVARYVEHLRNDRPDVVVLLDNPGLHMILAKEAKRRGIPVLYYICPQYWGWAPWRLRRFKEAVDGAIAILPFERPMFEDQGIPTGFAGNPLATRIPQLAAEPREPILALLPGSRGAEIERNLPAMLDLFARFRQSHPEARAILPQQNARHMQRIRTMCEDAKAAGKSVDGIEFHEGGVFSVLARARAALVKSGTSTLQTALCRTPQVVFFTLSGRFEAWLSRRFLAAPFIAAPNLILGRSEVPEFLFHRPETWESIYEKLEAVWLDGEVRDRQLTALDEVRRRASGTGATTEAVRWICPE